MQANAKEEEMEREKDDVVLATIKCFKLGERLQAPGAPVLSWARAGSLQLAGSSSKSWLLN